MNFRPTLPAQLYPSLKALIRDCWKNNPEERPTFDEVVTRLSGAIALEVNRMPEPDVTVEEGESTSLSTTTHFDDDTFLGGSEDMQSLRKGWDEERARLQVELARMKLAEENTKQLGTTFARQLEEKDLKIASLEERLKENSAEGLQGGEGGNYHTTTMRLG